MILGNAISIFNQSARGDTIPSILTRYGALHAWSAENLNISGTTTTALDYLGTHDLPNPSAGNQPVFNVNGAVGVNSKPSLTFDGISHHLLKAVSDWRGSDATGVFMGVFRRLSGANTMFLTTADTATLTSYYYLPSLDGNFNSFFVNNAGALSNLKGDIAINDTNPHVISNGSKGSSYHEFIDSVESNLAVLGGVGSDDGVFLDAIAARDNISIGALIRSAFPGYSNMEWAFSGYFPYVSDADIIALQNDLKTYYGFS